MSRRSPDRDRWRDRNDDRRDRSRSRSADRERYYRDDDRGGDRRHDDRERDGGRWGDDARRGDDRYNRDFERDRWRRDGDGYDRSKYYDPRDDRHDRRVEPHADRERRLDRDDRPHRGGDATVGGRERHDRTEQANPPAHEHRNGREAASRDGGPDVRKLLSDATAGVGGPSDAPASGAADDGDGGEGRGEEAVVLDSDFGDPDAAMASLMGFTVFDTTKGKAVEDNQKGPAKGAAKLVLQRKYRQYMNRVGGFNRNLDAIK